jgi:predicted 3-demethylubiquinone-9 3-methyltransferase (glyoxalase superfamily)
MARFQRITPFLWFDSEAEEAAKFYTSIFNGSAITGITRYNADSSAASGRPAGSVMTVSFELEGEPFVALNGGLTFKFSEAISFVVNCRSQEEIDHFWGELSAGGDEEAQQCGWLKDKYGVSWQVVPVGLGELLSDPVRGGRAMKALMQMKKLDLRILREP